jgi:hypothetical protein
MALSDEFFREPGYDPFGAAIKFWRNSLGKWSNLGDAHESLSFLRQSAYVGNRDG